MAGPGAGKRLRSKFDWEAIERDYRTGKYSLQELANKYGPHVSTISNRAVRDRWHQDVSEVVRVATQAEIARQTLLDSGYIEKAQADLRDTIEATAAVNAHVAGVHRRQLAGLRNAMGEMVEELASITGVPLAPGVTLDDVALVAGLTAKDTAALLRTPTLGYRVQVAEKLAGAMSKTILLERQIHGLDAVPEDQTFEARMAKALADRGEA